MKLVQKINRQYIVYTFIILLLAGISLFFTIKSIIREESDEKLVESYRRIASQLEKTPGDSEWFPMFSVISDSSLASGHHFSDTSLKIRHEFEEYRQLVAYKTIQGRKYKITVRESELESDDLLETLTMVILLSFSGLLMLLFIINRRISKRIWRPFFENLEKLKQFSLQDIVPYNPTISDTDEFNELNHVLKSLTDKVITDYDNLKKFSENASHEIQTPLAIIQSKIEALLDENRLSGNQPDKVKSIYQAVKRLSKINSGLLLLTKIENRQFSELEEINLDRLIKTQIESFNELMVLKQLNFEYICNTEKHIEANKLLVEMLINNLFSNAILHNAEMGQIKIELNVNSLIFSNTGSSNIPDSDRLFERFYKSGTTGSTGLGLSIAKQICLGADWMISYSYRNDLHIFSVSFPA